MQKLLIAVHTPALADALALRLQDRYQIYRCSTGTAALEILDAVRPEALILYLGLPLMDGLTVLQRCSHKPASVLALSNLITDSVAQRAYRLGVQRIVPIPCTAEYVLRCLTAIETLPAPG